MITIGQLLESVDLDFEPRWVTKDEDGTVSIWEKKPVYRDDCYGIDDDNYGEMDSFGKIKLAEFTNKPWAECIYEVPRKTTGKIEKLKIHETSSGGNDMVLHIQKTPATPYEMHHKINELVDAVNELKEKGE